MKMRNVGLMALGFVAVSSISACGPSEKGEQMSHETARQMITGNTTDIATKISTSINFLQTSNLFDAGVDAAGVPWGDDSICYAEVDPVTGDTVEVCDGPSPEPVEIDTDITDETAELVDFLEQYILNDANVEETTATSVTYLLKGSVVCTVDGDTDPDCAQQIDDAEIRLHVTSPAQGDANVALWIGPQKAEPLYFEFHNDQLALEVDLAGIKGAAQHFEQVTGEPLTEDFPATMQGRVRVSVRENSAQSVTGTISVVTAINVKDGDYAFSLGVSEPALEVTADAAAQTIESRTDLGTLDVLFPVTEYSYDVETDTETEVSHNYSLHVGGVTGTTLFDAASELITMTGLGLGDSTTTLSVDGAQILGIDLNANDGRSFDATAKWENDALTLGVSPAFDLQVAMQFANAASAAADAAEWMLDEVLTVRLDGAANPTVRLTENGVEVVDGTLTLSMANAGLSHSVGAGMCLTDVPASADGPTDPLEPGVDPVPVEETNPLEEVEVTTCGG